MSYYDIINSNVVAYSLIKYFGYDIDILSDIIWIDSPCCTFEKDTLCINVSAVSFECVTCGSKFDLITFVCKKLKINRNKAIEFISHNFCDVNIKILSV